MGQKRSPAQRIERLEGMVMGMGLLLAKLDLDTLEEGVREQVTAAITDCKQLAGNIKAREVTKV